MSKISKKSKIIVALLVIGALLFVIVRFVVIPMNLEKAAKYQREQMDSLTHHIESVFEYESQYIGDNVNTGNLFNNLPMYNVSKRFEIDSAECNITVSYLDTVWNIGKEKVQRDLIYNSIASFALVDNLEKIAYKFPGESFSFERSKFEKMFGKPLSKLLDEKTWNDRVQTKLHDEKFVTTFY
ncbi:MAG: DUF4825 domain-containing protein [Anaerovoracaceae bacterium]